MIPETPNTRKEMYLSRMAGQEVEIPQMPHTREEMYLDAIANNGGGGGGGGELFVVNLSYDADHQMFSADKTNAEIYAAFQSGKRIELYERYDSYIYFMRLAAVGTDHARFASIVVVGSQGYLNQVEIEEDGVSYQSWELAFN